MKISESSLQKVYFTTKFRDIYKLEAECPIILNSLSVYAVKDKQCEQKVEFDVRLYSNGDKFIRPDYAAKDCDYFLLTGERLALCKMVEIKAEDYVNMTSFDDCFTFIIEEKDVQYEKILQHIDDYDLVISTCKWTLQFVHRWKH